MLKIAPSPVQQIMHHPGVEHGVSLFVKRDDLNHSLAQGNKIRKLAPVFELIERESYSGILTFGGAFSNHLYATAALAHEMGIRSVGIVRGTWADPENASLRAIRAFGIQLHYVSASEYAAGSDSPAVKRILALYPNIYVVPEGGYSREGIRGCIGLGEELKFFAQNQGWQPENTLIAMAAGTGGTATGVIEGLCGAAHLLIIGPTNKGIDEAMIRNGQELAGLPYRTNFSVVTNYTFGGFGRENQELFAFMQQFYAETQIKPDPVYTGKVFYGVYDLLKKLRSEPELAYPIQKNANIILVHTGGLQGWNGWKLQL